MSASAAHLDQEAFPEVPAESRPRNVYFRKLSTLDRAMLRERGYMPACLLELPRSTPEQEVAYLMAKAQGIEEGTIIATEDELHALELEMKAYNLLSQKRVVVRFNVGQNQREKTLEEIFGTWQGSRHTLRGNTTIEVMQLPKLKRKELPVGEGKRPKGDTAREKRKRRK